MRTALILLLLAGFSFSCNPLNPDDDTLQAPQALYKRHVESIQDECFELKMEKWFILFHHYQDEGLGMFEADRKAQVQAELELKSCVRSLTNGTPHELKTARK